MIEWVKEWGETRVTISLSLLEEPKLLLRPSFPVRWAFSLAGLWRSPVKADLTLLRLWLTIPPTMTAICGSLLWVLKVPSYIFIVFLYSKLYLPRLGIESSCSVSFVSSQFQVKNKMCHQWTDYEAGALGWGLWCQFKLKFLQSCWILHALQRSLDNVFDGWKPVATFFLAFFLVIILYFKVQECTFFSLELNKDLFECGKHSHMYLCGLCPFADIEE